MKYIDADKLKAALARHYAAITIPVLTDEGGIESYIRRSEIHVIQRIIDSLQEEQDLIIINKKDLEAQEQFRKNKDFGKPLQQEQPEVDLEKDIESWFFNEISSKINVEHTMYHYFQECARRYFELGRLNAEKEEEK